MNDPTAPNSTADPPVSANDGRWLQVSRVLGLIVSIAVVAAALGRQFGLPFLQGPATGWDAMRANGTLGLLLSGLALALAARPEGARAARYSVTGLAIAVIGFGVQRAADIFLRWSEAMLGVDGDSELSALLWRMSPMSAFGLLFAGIGLLIAARPMPARLRGTVAAAMGSAVLGISAMRVLGLGLSTWRGFPWWTIVCCFSRKKSRNCWRIWADVSMGRSEKGARSLRGERRGKGGRFVTVKGGMSGKIRFFELLVVGYDRLLLVGKLVMFRSHVSREPLGPRSLPS